MTEHLDPDTLAAPLRALVVAIDAGELAAGVTARAYLAGALAALDAISAGEPVALPETHP